MHDKVFIEDSALFINCILKTLRSRERCVVDRPFRVSDVFPAMFAGFGNSLMREFLSKTVLYIIQ